MGEDQEQKHVCKFCKKSFTCGRSLGGHMRSHMTNSIKNSTNSPVAAEAKNNNKKKLLSSVNDDDHRSNYMVDFEAGGQAGYGLRENPKKTWRLSDSIDETNNNNSSQEKLCKECGKGFQSWKALFGHMRCHSDKEKISNYSLEENSWNAQNQKLVIDSQSDNEATAAAPRRRRRSRRTRYRATVTTAAATVTTTTTNTTTTTTTTTATTTSSFSFANASPSSVSEIEQEQEEVALCLMMLSRDVGCWGGGGLNNSVADSSDNNSVVVEVRSSGLAKRITETEDWNGDQRNLKMKKSVVSSDLENGRFERKVSELGCSNFGVLKNGFKKSNSEVPVDGSFGEDKIKNPRQDDEAGIEVSDAELGKNATCQDDLESGGKYDLSKKTTRYDPYGLEIGKDNCSPKKTSKFECTTCNKIFHSYQALGGHRASHKKIKGCFATKTETSENSIETDVSPDPIDDVKLIKSCENESLSGNGETSNVAKRSKHECPICFKIFASGQALGGHKRSHVVESNEARGNQSIVIQQKLPEIRDLLDLNLPAPIDQEDANSSHIGLRPWWIGSNHKHEPVVAAGVISN